MVAGLKIVHPPIDMCAHESVVSMITGQSLAFIGTVIRRLSLSGSVCKAY